MAANPPAVTSRRIELLKCSASPHYFLDRHVLIRDDAAGEWLPFRLWPSQAGTLGAIHGATLTVILKARQLGFSWLVLAYALWLMLYRRGTALVFCHRDEDAMRLLARVAGMHRRLPEWMRLPVTADSKHELALANGSSCMAFPTTGGRSYTAGLAVVDEAAFVPDLQELLNAVKPTVDAGGKLVLLSTADKARPESLFNRIYLAARRGENSYRPVFYGWRARPGRTEEWYAQERRNCLAQTGALDDLHQEYPETDVEALSPRTLDKRIPAAWLQACYREGRPLRDLPPDAPAVPGLEVYATPWEGRAYVVGADPAQGNPTSDDSALTVLDAATGEEAAVLAGKLQPAVLAAYADQVGRWYNDAAVLCERNNHGHAVLLWLEEHSSLRVLAGHDGNPGWLSSQLGKAVLYDACADAFRNQETALHSFATFNQLASIDGSTLRAPEGQHDDRADSYALALAGRQAAGLGLADVGLPGPAARNVVGQMPRGVFGR